MHEPKKNRHSYSAVKKLSYFFHDCLPNAKERMIRNTIKELIDEMPLEALMATINILWVDPRSAQSIHILNSPDSSVTEQEWIETLDKDKVIYLKVSFNERKG